jgi:hypothetical protein
VVFLLDAEVVLMPDMKLHFLKSAVRTRVLRKTQKMSNHRPLKTLNMSKMSQKAWCIFSAKNHEMLSIIQDPPMIANSLMFMTRLR